MSRRKQTDWVGECIRVVATLLIGFGVRLAFTQMPA